MPMRQSRFNGKHGPSLKAQYRSTRGDKEDHLREPILFPCSVSLSGGPRARLSPRDLDALIADPYAAYAYVPELLAEAAGLP